MSRTMLALSIVGFVLCEYALFAAFGQPLIAAQERCDATSVGCWAIAWYFALAGLGQLGLLIPMIQWSEVAGKAETFRKALEEHRPQ